MDILQVDQIHTYYSDSYILQGLSLKVPKASIAVILGRNGMGKSTTISSIVGFAPPRKGNIYFKGENITGLPSFKICRKGMALVPQGRRIFPSLTVKENIAIAAHPTGKTLAQCLEKVLSFFPVLKPRLGNKGNQLSGGEQQMLAIARALVADADLMLMDEPSEGLAPMIISQIGKNIHRLKEEGFSIFLAEQHLSLALKVADYIYVLNKGLIVFEGTPQDLSDNQEVEQEYLAV